MRTPEVVDFFNAEVVDHFTNLKLRSCRIGLWISFRYLREHLKAAHRETDILFRERRDSTLLV